MSGVGHSGAVSRNDRVHFLVAPKDDDAAAVEALQPVANTRTDDRAVLVVDDLRTFPFLDAVYARTSAEALSFLNQAERAGGLDALWLDHDLGPVPPVTPTTYGRCSTGSRNVPYTEGRCRSILSWSTPRTRSARR